VLGVDVVRRAELTPAAAELARQIAERVIIDIEPMLRRTVAEVVGDLAPTCSCETPLAEISEDETRCLRCGRRAA
jgi:hypothetical protein